VCTKTSGLAAPVVATNQHGGRAVIPVARTFQQIVLQSLDGQLRLVTEVAVDAAPQVAQTPQVLLQVAKLAVGRRAARLAHDQPGLSIAQVGHRFLLARVQAIP